MDEVTEKEMDEVRRKLMEVKLPTYVTLTINLNPAQVEALSRLCERLGPAPLMDIADDEGEAKQMFATLSKLAFALSGAR